MEGVRFLSALIITLTFFSAWAGENFQDMSTHEEHNFIEEMKAYFGEIPGVEKMVREEINETGRDHKLESILLAERRPDPFKLGGILFQSLEFESMKRERFLKEPRRCLLFQGFKDINIFVAQEAYMSNSDVGGRMIVGQDATIENLSIGKLRFFGLEFSCPQIRHLFTESRRLLNNSEYNVMGASAELGNLLELSSRPDQGLLEKEYSLIVNRTLRIRRSQVSNGGVAFGSEIADIGVNSIGVGSECSITQKGNLIRFDRFIGIIKFYSCILNNMQTTSSFEKQVGHTLVLKLTGNDETEVFRIPGVLLLETRALKIEGKIATSSPIVINVDSKVSGFTNMNMDALAPYQNNLIWNFYRAKVLFFYGVAMRGTILAPWSAM